MDGKYLNDNRIKTSIQTWLQDISSLNGTWEGNNIHIDEIESLDKITRDEWVNVSFNVINILSNNVKLVDSLILFLHIDLKYSIGKSHLEELSLNWLRNNVSEYTPPSLHCTSFEYYNDFYKKELVNCYPDYSILELIYPSVKLDFFYRIYFDVDENMYSREIYVFLNN